MEVSLQACGGRVKSGLLQKWRLLRMYPWLSLSHTLEAGGRGGLQMHEDQRARGGNFLRDALQSRSEPLDRCANVVTSSGARQNRAREQQPAGESREELRLLLRPRSVGTLLLRPLLRLSLRLPRSCG